LDQSTHDAGHPLRRRESNPRKIPANPVPSMVSQPNRDPEQVGVTKPGSLAPEVAVTGEHKVGSFLWLLPAYVVLLLGYPLLPLSAGLLPVALNPAA
jgi:hypothetical protein